ncbi:hypothetical protein MMC12_002700 [Toensbergia leucococca]|nr:hypothetical protein [Toensbergia leucococca]
MANNTTWQVLHYLVIVVHLIMFIAGVATYASNSQNLSWNDVASIGNADADLNAKEISWAVGGVGIAGLIGTAVVFWRLLYLQRASPEGITQEAWYLKRKIAYISSIILLGCLVIADIASGAAVATKVSDFGDLAAPVAFAFIAAIISLATLVTDSLQLREYSQQRHSEGNGAIEEVEMPKGGYGLSGV